MYRPDTSAPTAARRDGVALMIVVVLLTLFAVVAVAFMFYSEAQATSSRIFRESQSRTDLKPEEVLAFALGQLIYDVDPNHPATPFFNSAMQGHGLARTEYDFQRGDSNVYPFAATTVGTTVYGGNIYPYNGAGRFHFTYPPVPNSGVFTGQDDINFPNFQQFSADNTTVPRQAGWINTAPTGNPAYAYIGGLNPNYTYPDQGNQFLAAVRSDGTVIARSFDRIQWTLQTLGPPFSNLSLDPAAPASFWTVSPTNNPLGMSAQQLALLKYISLRPRPADQLNAGESLSVLNGQFIALPSGRSVIGPPNFFTDPTTNIQYMGDAKNLRDAPGGMDSLLMDLGFPVRTVAGRRVKPLFAFLVSDLDNRLNLNVHGNARDPIHRTNNPMSVNAPPYFPPPSLPTPLPPQPPDLGVPPMHVSNQGWSKSEVNPGKVLLYGTRPDDIMFASWNPYPYPNWLQPEWPNLLIGSKIGAAGNSRNASGQIPGAYGRYGAPNGINPFPQPSSTGLAAPSGDFPRFYAQVDLDGNDENQAAPQPQDVTATQPMLLASEGTGPGAVPAYYPFPAFAAPTFTANGQGWGNGSPAERTNLPSSFNYFAPEGLGLERDRVFNIMNMKYLLNSGRFPTNRPDYLLSELYSLIPENLGEPNPLAYQKNPSPNSDPNYFLTPGAREQHDRLRRLLTTLSMDLDRPGLSPELWNQAILTNQKTGTTLPAIYATQGLPNVTYPTGSAQTYPSPLTLIGGGKNGWASPVGQPTSRIDLNRPLPPYPTYDPNVATVTFRTDISGTPQGQANLNAIQIADNARRQFATEIFQRLLYATTGSGDLTVVNDITVTPPTSPQHNTHRWLAQLAVNIVDYIDSDEVITSWQWYTPIIPPGFVGTPPTPEWVYGVEMPRLLLNEAYANYSNEIANWGTPAPPQEPTTAPGGTWTTARINFWLELFNPLNANANPTLPDPSNPNLAAGPTPYRECARLQVPSTAGVVPGQAAVYQVAVCDYAATQANLAQAANTAGDPNYNGTNLPKLLVTDFTPGATTPPKPGVDVSIVKPSNGFYFGPDQDNQGFYLLGSAVPLPGSATPKPLATLQVQEGVSYTGIPSAMALTGQPLPVPGAAAPQYTIVLRRLANPFLPPNPPPGGPPNPALPYNPYVTVDYMENISPNNDIKWSPGSATANATYLPGTHHAKGRRQPLAGANVPTTAPLLMDQNTTAGPGDQPQHSFFRHNYQGSPLGAPSTMPGYTAAASPPGTPPFPTAPPTVPPGPPPPSPGVDGTLKLPFDWMTFLDRQLISPIELLHVPAVGPAKLTQSFATGFPAGTPTPEQAQKHLANWTDFNLPAGQSTRLVRALELLGTGDRAAGMSAGGRVPGKININTLWDTGYYVVDPNLPPPGSGQPPCTPTLNNPAVTADTSFTVLNSPQAGQTRLGSNDVFRGLCDASPSNRFNQTDVDQIYAKLMRSRTANLYGIPGPNDRPFRGFAVPMSTGGPTDPQYQSSYSTPDMTSLTTQTPPGTYNGFQQASNNGIGLEDTILRSAPIATSPPGGPPVLPNPIPANDPFKPLFQTNGPHAYVQSELLRKISNSITTRSNVFAVWVTVGLFEVTDETSNPVKLGKEVGSDTGTQKRMRFFSIVDRTNLAIDPASFIPPGSAVNPANPNPPVGTASLKQAVKPFFLPYKPVLVRKDATTNDLSAAPQQITGAGTVTVVLPPVDLEIQFVGPAPPNANPGPYAPNTGYPNQSVVWPPDQANTGVVPLQGGTTSFPVAIPNPAQTQQQYVTSQVLGTYEGFPWQTYVFNLLCDPTTPYGRNVLQSQTPIIGIVGTPTAPTNIQANIPVGAPTTSGTLQPPFPPPIPTPPTNPYLRSMLLIDDGDRQEMVFVEKVETTVQSVNGVNVLVPMLTFTTTKTHAAGCTISNVPLGNPGPQGPIDWSADNFRHVVPLATILE
jgi:hypothetical protein